MWYFLLEALRGMPGVLSPGYLAVQEGACDNTPFPLSHCYASFSTLMRRRRGNFPYRQEPAVFPYSEAQRNDFRAIFVTKCQFRIDKGKHNHSNGVSSHVPSLSVMLWLSKG